MRRPQKELLGLTWLGWLNAFFQFLFMRLVLSVVDKRNHPEDKKVVGFGVALAVPFTGWDLSPWPRTVRLSKVVWFWRHPSLFRK